jgi:hypothetical protein
MSIDSRFKDCTRIEEYENTIKLLTDRIDELETRLKKYTNGDNHKRYYEKNKDKIKESGSLYLQKLKEENPDKIKEYSRKAYIKKKTAKQQAETAVSGGDNITTVVNNSNIE